MRVDHLMYADDFKLLVKRLEETETKDIDEKIRSFVRMVNFSPALVTIFSCQGHPNKRIHYNGSVMFGVRNKDHMYKLYDLIRAEFGEHQHLVGLTMTTTPGLKTNSKTGKRPWWAVWNLHWKFNKKLTRQQGWQHLENAGVKFLKWLKEQGSKP